MAWGATRMFHQALMKVSDTHKQEEAIALLHIKHLVELRNYSSLSGNACWYRQTPQCHDAVNNHTLSNAMM